MRHGRAKAARRTLQFFRLTHQFNPPYDVILDGTFLLAMMTQKIPLKERLLKTLQHKPFRLSVTRSSLNELKSLSEQDTPKKDLFRQAWRWGLDECDKIIEPDDIPITETQSEDDTDITRLVEAKHLYFIATQDEGILDSLRSLGSVPLLRLARGVLLLENPSKSSQTKALRTETSKWTVAGSVNEHERNLVSHVREKQKQEERHHTNAASSTRRPRQKAKGPNPLSCKRKQSQTGIATEATKRKRRRKKKSASTGDLASRDD